MTLAALPTIYDLTPDYASNLAGSTEMFWPGDQGRWQAANLAAGPTPTQVGWMVGGALALAAAWFFLKDAPSSGYAYRRTSRHRYGR